MRRTIQPIGIGPSLVATSPADRPDGPETPSYSSEADIPVGQCGFVAGTLYANATGTPVAVGAGGDVLTGLQALTMDEVGEARAALEIEPYDSYSVRGVTTGGPPLVPRDSYTIAATAADSNYGFPGAVRLRNGDIYSVARWGVHHEGCPGAIRASRSADLGRTWSTPVTILSPDGATFEDLRDPMLAVLSDGRIAMTGFVAKPYTGATSAGGWCAFGTQDADGVVTWGARVTIAPFAALGVAGLVTSKMIEAGGALLVAGYDTGGNIRVFRSTDSGVTWSQYAEINTTGGGNTWSEPMWTVLPDGSIPMMIRKNAGGTDTVGYYFSVSADNGATWSAPELKLATVGSPGRPAIEYLQCGALLMAARSSTATGTGSNMFCHTSWDGGVTWIASQPNGMTAADAAYPGSYMTTYSQIVPLSPNEALVVSCAQVSVTSAGWYAKAVTFGNSVGPAMLAHDYIRGSTIQSPLFQGIATAAATFTPINVAEPLSLNSVASLGAQKRAGFDNDYWGFCQLRSFMGGSLQTMAFTNYGGQVALETGSNALAFYVNFTGNRTVGTYFDGSSGAGINVSSGQTFRAYIAGTAVMDIGATTASFARPFKLAPYAKSARPTLGASDYAIIWQTTDTPGPRYWDGSAWCKMDGTSDP